MKMQSIISQRTNEGIYWFDLVYEWEDILKDQMGLSFVHQKRILNSKIALKFHRLFSMLQTNKNALAFEMTTSNLRVNNNKNIIPWIIDFYPSQKTLKDFYRSYNKNKAILISSRQVYQYLLNAKCPLNIWHVALSLSDKYEINKGIQFDKIYNLVVTGRSNPVLMEYLERYVKENKEFVYVYQKQKDKHQHYYMSTGEYIGVFDSREEYISLLRQSRMAFYSTSGVDGDARKGTNGFHQVTPKFLEFIASGCHVLSRYEDNEDTDFYELGVFSMRIDSYESFKKAVDFNMTNDVDIERYSDYLAKHYTSVRANQLDEILKQI